jgi:hypothetical protein
MGEKLLPLSIPELCAHALELERDAEMRFREYAARMRELGSEHIAAAFDEKVREQQEEVRALEAASGGRARAELSPFEYAWRLTYLPDGMDDRPRLMPRNAREALQFSLIAKRRAESFYLDVAENARDVVVRGCAAEMASAEHRQVELLERLLAGEIIEAQFATQSGGRDVILSR